MSRIMLICILLVILGNVFATEYVVGTGTSYQNRFPVNGANDFGWSKMIFTKAEINASGLNSSGTVIGIGFNVDNFPTNYAMNNQNVFIRHTNSSSYTLSSEPLPDSTSFTFAFHGTVTYHGNGWVQVVFSTSFVWDNVRNIEILWKNRDGSLQSDFPYFRYTTTSPNYRAVCLHGDGGFPLGSGDKYYNRPNIQFITTMLPNSALAEYPADNGWAMPNTSLRWKNGGGCPTTYDVYFGTANPPVTLVSDNQTSPYYTPLLTANTNYYWQIVPANSSGSASSCPVWTFRTLAATQLTESFEGSVFPPAGWSNPGGFALSPSFPFHGSKAIYINSGTTGNLLNTPLLSISTNSKLSFCARQAASSSNARVRVRFSANGTSWTMLGSAITLPANTDWNSFEVNLGVLAGNNYYLALETYSASSSGNVYIYLDHIIGPNPVGALPTPELSANVNGNDIDLNWNAVSGATGYNIYSSDDPYAWTEFPLASVGAGTQSFSISLSGRKFFRVRAIAE